MTIDHHHSKACLYCLGPAQEAVCRACNRKYSRKPANKGRPPHMWRDVPERPASADFSRFLHEARSISSLDILTFFPDQWPPGRQTWRDALGREGQRRGLLPADGRPGALVSPDYTKAKSMSSGRVFPFDGSKWRILATLPTGQHIAELKQEGE